MYVKAYLDLSLKSLVFSLVVASGPVHLGAWPGGSWLPWRAVPFFAALSAARQQQLNGPVQWWHCNSYSA